MPFDCSSLDFDRRAIIVYLFEDGRVNLNERDFGFSAFLHHVFLLAALMCVYETLSNVNVNAYKLTLDNTNARKNY